MGEELRALGALLSMDRVGIRFGGLRALSGFSLELADGELVGLIGPNGAGKTTVFNLITGVYRPDEGQIRFQGRSLIGLRPSQIAALGIARTFQNIRLFKGLSVLDNVRIAYYARQRAGLAEAVLGFARARREEDEATEVALERLRQFGLSRWASEPAGSLPYGDQRRLEMARALASHPRLLLLDEPAAGMNPLEADRLRELIGEVHRRFGVAIILIEHQMRVVMKLCPRIVVLDFGETIAQGPPDEVRRHPRVLEAYLGKEVHGP